MKIGRLCDTTCKEVKLKDRRIEELTQLKVSITIIVQRMNW